MMDVVHIAQTLVSDMGIDLRGGNIAVSKQHLNHAKIGAMVQ
jgi:hypothetical protein